MPAPPPVDRANIRRILFIRPRYLGDICLTLPLVDAVRAACPAASIAYVLERGLEPLLAGDPRFAEVIAVPAKPSLRGTQALLARLRAFSPDLVFDCFCNPRTAIWAGLSGARVRVGYPNKGWRSAMYTHHARPRARSATGFHLASLEAIGWPSPHPREACVSPTLHVSAAAREAAERAMSELGVRPGAMLVGFHPGARWPTRRWAPERFTALIARLLDERPSAVAVLTAGPGEEALAASIATELPGERVRVVSGWPIARFVALQACCQAFVCGDTGPLHTAVAAGCPTLALMSRNRPSTFFPYPARDGHRALYARVECSPCDRDQCADLRCLHRLTVAGAWELLRAMLDASPRRADTAPVGVR